MGPETLTEKEKVTVLFSIAVVSVTHLEQKSIKGRFRFLRPRPHLLQVSIATITYRYLQTRMPILKSTSDVLRVNFYSSRAEP